MTETSLQQDGPVAIPVRSFGKRVRSMAGYTIVTALMFVSPLFVFIPTALLHCGIRNGRRAAWLLLVLSADNAIGGSAEAPSLSDVKVFRCS